MTATPSTWVTCPPGRSASPRQSPTECGAAAALANIEAQLPGEVTYDVQFGKPLLLPAKVNLYTRRIDGKGNFDIEIRNRRKGYPHLTATLRYN